MMKAPKEHTRRSHDSPGKVYATKGTKLNPEGREQDYEGPVDEARDLRLSLDSPSSQGETTEEF